MGKLARLRSRSSSSSVALAVRGKSREMRRPGTMRTSTVGRARGCRASSVILGLLFGFSLVLFTIFFFTLRPGHQHQRVQQHATSSPTRFTFRKQDESGSDTQEEFGGPDGDERLVDSVGVYGYEIVREFYHDPRAFTQGLVYAGNETLYESTGLYGQSSVREVDLLTGEPKYFLSHDPIGTKWTIGTSGIGQVRRIHTMKREDFGEGLTIWKNRLLQVIWKERKVLMYDVDTLLPVGELSHKMQDGWGLTTSDNHIIGSDGTSKLHFMNPDTFEEVKVVTVRDEDKEVGWLNELEFVNNEIWANIWQGSCIATISPQDGKVTGWILLHGLRNELLAAGSQGVDVLNGIAWDSVEDRVYVTGKMWPKLFQIRLLNRTSNANGSLQAVRQFCNVGQEGFQ